MKSVLTAVQLGEVDAGVVYKTDVQAARIDYDQFKEILTGDRGFIRAFTIAYEDYVRLKGEAGAREAGKFRQEGKEYVVKDGDVMNFRFNV